MSHLVQLNLYQNNRKELLNGFYLGVIHRTKS